MSTQEVSTTLSVADLMTPEPIVVRDTDPVAFAETVLRDFRITGLPVVDASARLVGVFSETDSLFLKLPSVAQAVGSKSTPARVGDVMSHPPITVSSTASITSAAALMIEHSVHRLVVVDDDGRPSGVLSSMDFVRLAAEAGG
jgi:CBS domain-containing protein